MLNVNTKMCGNAVKTYHFALAPGADATQSDQPHGTHDGCNRHQEHAERHRAWGRDGEAGISSHSYKEQLHSPFQGDI